MKRMVNWLQHLTSIGLLLWSNFVKLQSVISDPSTLVKVMKWWGISSTTLVELEETMIYHSRTLSDQRTRIYEGQESTYSGSEDLWQRVLTMSLLRDSEGKVQSYISTRDIKMKVPRGTWPGTQVYLSKAKLGIYNEYLGLYIHFWDRGTMSHSG